MLVSLASPEQQLASPGRQARQMLSTSGQFVVMVISMCLQNNSAK